jgi:predicted alpha/beta hydrolase family esterase
MAVECEGCKDLGDRVGKLEVRMDYVEQKTESNRDSISTLFAKHDEAMKAITEMKVIIATSLGGKRMLMYAISLALSIAGLVLAGIRVFG